jgi:hypothetical protein
MRVSERPEGLPARRRADQGQRDEAGGESEGFSGRNAAAGIVINTASTDFAPIKQLQMMRFDGTTWQLFGPVMSSGQGGT